MTHADDPSRDDQHAALRALLDVHPEARELGRLFDEAGHELYLVGGSVRDTLLDEAAPDLDFATSARPEETERLLEGWADNVWDIGARFGTISALKDDREIEVTTYRSDEYQAGSRHPEVTFGDSILTDLSRRDFTVNAMAVRVPEFEFLDPYGGLRDLQTKVLRTPIDPQTSFSDDPLRMVRLARFAAVLDARPHPETETAASAMAHEVATVSSERIRDELDKLLVAPNPADGIDLLVRTGLSSHFLPELDLLAECIDPQHRHKDVYAHTLAVVESCPPERTLRLAALLHDIGKPDTRDIHGDGTVTFHHHEVVGARMAEKRLRELRYDKHTIGDVTKLVFMHLRFHTYKMGWTDSAVRRYVNDAGDLLDRLNALTRADVTTGNDRKRARIMARMDELEERIDELEEQEELDKLRPALDGNQIMEHLDLDPGPLVGEAWDFLLGQRIEQGPMSEDEARRVLDEWWDERSEDGSA